MEMYAIPLFLTLSIISLEFVFADLATDSAGGQDDLCLEESGLICREAIEVKPTLDVKVGYFFFSDSTL